jgi:hypothetical protein
VKCGQLFAGTLEAGFSIGRTSVKKLLPPQAMRGILLGRRGLVRSYVTLAIIKHRGNFTLPYHLF